MTAQLSFLAPKPPACSAVDVELGPPCGSTATWCDEAGGVYCAGHKYLAAISRLQTFPLDASEHEVARAKREFVTHAEVLAEALQHESSADVLRRIEHKSGPFLDLSDNRHFQFVELIDGRVVREMTDDHERRPMLHPMTREQIDAKIDQGLWREVTRA